MNPELTDKSAAGNFQRRKIDWLVIENQLKDIISNKAVAAPSASQVARSFGLNKRLLYSHFPDLCNVISENYASYLRTLKQKRI